MMTTTLFDTHLTTASRIHDVDLNNPAFGSVFSDHQFRMDFQGGDWKPGVIEPYADMSISPAAMVFHYGQAICDLYNMFCSVVFDIGDLCHSLMTPAPVFVRAS